MHKQKMHMILFKTAIIIFLFSFQYLSAAEQRVVKVGSDDHFPVIFKDKDGTAKGLYVDILNEIGLKENIRFEYIFDDWGKILELIKNDKIDLLPGVGYTKERSLYMDYSSNPLLTAWGELYARKSSDIYSLLDLSDKKIGGVRNDINSINFLELIKKFNLNCQFIELTGYDDVFKAVADGAIDAGVAGITYGASKQEEYGLKGTGIVFNPYDLFIATSKGKNGDLILLLDRNLNEWKTQTDSVLVQAKRKWIYGSLGSVAVLPDWLFKLIISSAVILAMCLAFIMLLRVQVKKATAETRQREQVLRSYIDNSPDGVFIADENGRYLDVNPAAGRITGYSMQELLSKSMTDMVPPESSVTGFNDFKTVKETGFSSGEFLFLHRSGEKRWWSVDAVKLDDTRYLGFTKDITLRKEAGEEIRLKNKELKAVNEELSSALEKMEATNEELTNSNESLQRNKLMLMSTLAEHKLSEEKVKNLLAEKKLLLQEVHHRIKNNMNTIMGLLLLQSGASGEPAIVSALDDAGRRVHSMMILYDKLYQSVNSHEISLAEYLPALINEIVSNFPDSNSVKIIKNIDDIVLNANVLQPLGIIVNELLTNIMKYAFKDRSEGLINVSAALNGNAFSLTIQDNGVGIPESITFANSTGFGMHLVSMLSEQIGGSIRIERGYGTKFIFEFEV